MGNLRVALYFVNIGGLEVDLFYYACGDSGLAGPFMSAGSADDWRDQFAGGAEVVLHWNDEADICTGPPLFADGSRWVRG